MAKTEWFRRTTWTAEDETAFHARLRRSRGTFQKAQYLRIQALHLQMTGAEAMLRGAVTLLELLVAECPDESQLSGAYKQMAECHAMLGNFGAALTVCRDAIAAQRHFPNLANDAPVTVAVLTLALGRAGLYSEAAELLEEFGAAESPFPAGQFYYAMLRAVLADEQGEVRMARLFAEQALVAAGVRESPFLRHPGLGLIGQITPELELRLAKLTTTE